MKGSIVVERAPAGKKTKGPLPKDALLSMTVKMSTVLVTEDQTSCEYFQGYEQAQEMANEFSGCPLVLRLLGQASCYGHVILIHEIEMHPASI